jgi:hypothetical protein
MLADFKSNLRSKVLTVLATKNFILFDITSHNLLEVGGRFGGTVVSISRDKE